ncbi:MAG TPA: hypothetical protein VIN09_07845 [Chloroflexota bacterium]|jgi:hypothetical protein
MAEQRIQRWEYRVLRAYSDGSIFLDDQKIDRRDGVTALLNQLGDEGWELVGQSEAVGPAGGDISYTFRRPKR